jgi:hypothetical protein
VLRTAAQIAGAQPVRRRRRPYLGRRLLHHGPVGVALPLLRGTSRGGALALQQGTPPAKARRRRGVGSWCFWSWRPRPRTTQTAYRVQEPCTWGGMHPISPPQQGGAVQGVNIGREAGPQTAAGGCTLPHHGSHPGRQSPQPWQDPVRWHALLQLQWNADAGHAAPAGPLACVPMKLPIEAAMLIYWLASGAAGERPAPFTTSNPIQIRFPPNSRLLTRPGSSKALTTIPRD